MGLGHTKENKMKLNTWIVLENKSDLACIRLVGFSQNKILTVCFRGYILACNVMNFI